MKTNTKKFLQVALILAGSAPAIMLPVLVAPQNTITAQAAQTVDVTGTVVDVNNRGFTFKPDGRGGTYTIVSNNVPNGLKRGDKVRVRGTLNGTQVSATEIRITQSNTRPDNNQTQQDVTGLVESMRGNDGFTFRPDGRKETYTVRSRNLPRDLRNGDTVRVRGTLNGTQLDATEVRIVTSGNSGQANGNFDVTGTVRSVRNDGFTFRPDGRNDDYTVRGNNFPRDLREGDKVRVRGDVRGRDVTNAQVQDAYTSGTSGRDEPKRGVGNGEAVEFDAQINAVKGRRQVQAHLPSGTRYEIYSDRDLNLREGDYIRVRGSARRGGFYAIDADNVTQSSANAYRSQGIEIRTGLKDRNPNNPNNPNDPNRDNIRLRGRIENLGNDRFTLLVEDRNDNAYDDGNNGYGNNNDYPDYGIGNNRDDRRNDRGNNDRGNNNRGNNNRDDDTRRYNGRRFEVRFDTRNDRLRNGDSVVVTGDLNNNNVITANRVRLLNNR